MVDEDKVQEATTEETKTEDTPATAPVKEAPVAEEEKPAQGGSASGGKEEKKVEKKVEKAAPSGKFAQIIKDIEGLSVMELAELVKELEERFGVSAAAPVQMAGGAASQGGAAPAAEEKAIYTVHLVDGGTQKIAVIKAVREILPDMGLKEAKDLVDGAPKDVKKDVPKADAEVAKKKLEAAGAKVELK